MTVAGRTASLLVALAAGTAACSSPGHANVDPTVLLRQAKVTLDSATAVHFVLTSSNVTGGGTNLTGGSGDMARPDSLQGSFNVVVNGFPASVKAVSKGGVFEALLPFQAHFSRTDPANFGLTDPALLFDRTKGLTSLLAMAQNPHQVSSVRVAGELLEQISFTVPGTSLPVLPDANPSQPVTLTAAINPSTHEVRQITIVGPLTSSSDCTYVLTLTKYNEQASIALPPTS